MNRHDRLVAGLLALTVTTAVMAAGQKTDNLPAEPFRIAGNLYYVGSSDIGSYLIATPAGHIVIDAGYESTVPLIEANIRRLGFKVTDVRYLLNTQAHFDHAAGFAALKKATGAQLLVSDADADVIERGGTRDFNFGDANPFPAVHVDRRLKDLDTVTLGKLTVTAHLTPGHTMGCTTWTFEVTENSRLFHVVDVCGLSILSGTKLSGMPGYPGIAKDYEHTFATLRALPVDIFIGAHASYYGGMEKAARAKADPGGANPFIDPAGYRSYIDRVEQQFKAQLAAERAGRPPI